MATTWYYTNEKDERVSVTGGQLKWLAKNGKITPETIIETEDGRTAPARKVKGLTFIAPGATPSEPAQPAETDIYGLSAPPIKPSPFTAAIPAAEKMSVTAPSAVMNPFTATMPAVAKPAENPFTAPMPTVNQAMLQSVPVPVAEIEEHKKTDYKFIMFLYCAVMTLFLIALIDGARKGGLEWLANSGGGGCVAPTTKQSVYQGQFTAAEIVEIKAFCREYGISEEISVEFFALHTNMAIADSGGVTLLHGASLKGNVAVAKILVAKGANVNARDTKDDTPLHCAALGGNAEVYNFLVSKGANVHAVNRKGDTPAEIRRLLKF